LKQNNGRRQSAGELKDPVRLARIAFVQACWHRDIVDQARIGFLRAIKAKDLEPVTVECFEVPGAFEIPLQAKLLAQSGHYAAIVAAGFVVDGGIYRHEFVASSVIDALMRVQLETEVPTISVVLTPQHFHEHNEHQSFFRKHFIVKGEEAAVACAAAISSIRRLRARPHALKHRQPLGAAGNRV
jgi:6,7-dimethyl-8-ribityllumazine synthase